MLQSSARLGQAKVPTISTENAASEHKGPLLRAVQWFWKFSIFYGKFVSTPIHERKIRP